jgi:hypothetical protein
MVKYNMNSEYNIILNNTIENHEIDLITLENLNVEHPKGVITIFEGINERNNKELPLSCFNSDSIYEYITRCSGVIKNPKTRNIIDNNQIKRIKEYKKCVDKYPDIKKEDILDKEYIITEWIKEPSKEKNIDYIKYFVELNDIMKYFGFDKYNSREKATEYLNEPYNRSWIIRESSISNTKYNKFFVIQKKDGRNFPFVHIQGYGICSVTAKRFNENIKDVTIHYHNYWFSIGEFMIYLRMNNIIII